MPARKGSRKKKVVEEVQTDPFPQRIKESVDRERFLALVQDNPRWAISVYRRNWVHSRCTESEPRRVYTAVALITTCTLTTPTLDQYSHEETVLPNEHGFLDEHDTLLSELKQTCMHRLMGNWTS